MNNTNSTVTLEPFDNAILMTGFIICLISTCFSVSVVVAYFFFYRSKEQLYPAMVALGDIFLAAHGIDHARTYFQGMTKDDEVCALFSVLTLAGLIWSSCWISFIAIQSGYMVWRATSVKKANRIPPLYFFITSISIIVVTVSLICGLRIYGVARKANPNWCLLNNPIASGIFAFGYVITYQGGVSLIFLGIYIKLKTAQSKTNFEDTKKKISESIKRLAWYPLTFIVCFFPAGVFLVYELFTVATRGFTLIAVIVATLSPTLNAFVYFYVSQWRDYRRNKARAYKKTYILNLQMKLLMNLIHKCQGIEKDWIFCCVPSEAPCVFCDSVFDLLWVYVCNLGRSFVEKKKQLLETTKETQISLIF